MPGLHLFILFLISVGCLQIPPIWLTNSYVQSQCCDISTSNPNLSTTTSIVTYPFSAAFSAVPYIAYGIFNYEASDYMDEQCFSISATGYTSSSITLAVSVLQNTNILALTVRYIAIDGIFPYKLSSFDKISVNYSNGALTNITWQNSNINYYTNTINYTNLANTFRFSYNYFSLPLLNNKIVPFITSMLSFATQEDSDMLHPLNLKITTNILSTQTFMITVSFGILAKIEYLQLSMICFDYADVLSSNIYEMNYQIISFPSTGGLLSMAPQFYPNLMIGLIGYSSDRTCAYLNFNLLFLKDAIQMNQTVSQISTKIYQYSLLFLKSWICTNDTYFNITSNLCQSCSVLHCITCQFLTTCLICYPYYYLDNSTGKCEIITSQCGDGNYTLEQQCDDGNTQNGDGCSSICNIEGGFLCQTNPASGIFVSMCYYFDKISIQTLYIDKYDYSNTIEIVFKLVMVNPSVLNGIDLNTCLSISDPTLFQDYYIRQNLDGTFSIIGTYERDISNVQIDITLNLAQTGWQMFQRLPITIYQMIIIPNDNENALYYQENIYKTALVTSYLSYAICSLSLFMFVISLFGNKLVGLEMISVVQISYLSLLSLTPMNPCFKALSSLRYVNGISYYYSSEDYMQDPYTPNGFKGIYLYPQFCKNYNYMLLLILIPYILALISVILSRTLLKNKKQYLQNLAVRFLCQYAFLGLIYSGYIIAVFFGLEINYGLRDMTEMIGIISTTELVFLVVLLVIYFVLLVKKPEYFGQFMNQFVIMKFHKIQKMSLKQNEKLQPKYPNIFSRFWYNGLIIERLVVGSCLVFMYKIIVSSIVPICVFVLLVMLAIFKKPYNKFLHNIRFILNMIICISVQAIYLFYKIKSNQSYKQAVWYYLPIAICVLLLICVSYNAVIIIIEVRENYLNWRDKRGQLKEQEDYLMIQMTNREIVKNNQRQFNSKENISHAEMKQRKRIEKELRRQLRLKNKICQKYTKDISIIQEQSKQYSDI